MKKGGRCQKVMGENGVPLTDQEMATRKKKRNAEALALKWAAEKAAAAAAAAANAAPVGLMARVVGIVTGGGGGGGGAQ